MAMFDVPVDHAKTLATTRYQFRMNLRTAARGCTLDYDARRFQYHLLQLQRFEIRLIRKRLKAAQA